MKCGRCNWDNGGVVDVERAQNADKDGAEGDGDERGRDAQREFEA